MLPEPTSDVPVPVRWLRLLPHWSLMTALVTLVLPIVLFGGVGQQASDRALGAEYVELLQTARAPRMYRAGWALDALVWLLIGGSLLALAGTLSRRAPIRATFIAACGIAQSIGSLGSFLRLGGIGDLGALYATIGPDEQAVLLESYRALWRVINPHYHVGTLLQGAGFLLAAWGVFSMRGFPGWLALWLAVPGLLATVQFGLVATGAPFSLLLKSLGVIVGNVALNLAMAVALWHPPAPLVSAVAGDSA